jgi:hypothetical protein
LALRLTVWLALLALVAGMAPSGAHAEHDWAPPSSVWVEATGHTVSEPFLDVWRANLAYLGNPISEPIKRKVDLPRLELKTRTVQFFENAALVQTLDDPRGEDWAVQAVPLGEQTLERDLKQLKQQGVNPDRPGSCKGMRSDDCVRFERTGQTLRWGFKSFWEENLGEQLLGPPITEEIETGNGWIAQYFQRGVLGWHKEREVVPRAVGKELAEVHHVRTYAKEQPDGVPVYDASLFSPPVEEVESEEGVGAEVVSGPGPQQGGPKEIVVSISAQYLWAYDGDSVFVESAVSTGTAEVPETTTLTGFWAIHTKYEMQTMEGTISAEYYMVPDVPWVMYYDNAANALHGAYWHNNFGTPMSHGCVNLPVDIAGLLYAWAEIGTPVTVLA